MHAYTGIHIYTQIHAHHEMHGQWRPDKKFELPKQQLTGICFYFFHCAAEGKFLCWVISTVSKSHIYFPGMFKCPRSCLSILHPSSFKNECWSNYGMLCRFRLQPPWWRYRVSHLSAAVFGSCSVQQGDGLVSLPNERLASCLPLGWNPIENFKTILTWLIPPIYKAGKIF